MSEGNRKCKSFGECEDFTTAEECTTACKSYVPKNPNEVMELPDEVEAPELKLEYSNLPKFDKKHEFFVMKGHVFLMQNVSPKKIILKYRKKLKESDKLQDGCYVFKDMDGNLLEPSKEFKKMERK